MPRAMPDRASFGTWERRLADAAARVAAAEDVLEDERELRDRLIVQAVESGFPQAWVHKAARLSPRRVGAILERPMVAS